VIWLGIVLIALNLVINIGEIKSVIFGAESVVTPTAATTPEGNATIPAQPAMTPATTPTANQVTVA
jgi:hypothetical protein